MMRNSREHNQSTTTSLKNREKKWKHFFKKNKSGSTPSADKLMYVKSFEKDLERAKVF